jgi:hypothetical protein
MRIEMGRWLYRVAGLAVLLLPGSLLVLFLLWLSRGRLKGGR